MQLLEKAAQRLPQDPQIPLTRAALLEKIPLNAMGKAEDIAEAALFLAGPGGRYITGQTLVVDGGMVM